MSDSRSEETKIMYYRDNDDVPTLIRVNVPPDQVTLGDFKAAIHLKPGCHHKFFFKNTVEDVGIVKEEITDDDAKLPVFKGNIICYIVSEIYDDTGGSDIGRGGSAGLGVGHTHAHHPHHYHHRCNYGSTVMSSDVDSTTFVDSDLDDDDTTSRISTTTDETSVSRLNASRFRRKQRRRHRMPVLSRASSVSSITDSTISLNIITVTLDLDSVNFLGMSLVGQSNNQQDGGIYVGSIMKGGAVANDGRIQPGDMILQVNDINFENMSNDQAVEVLREAVQKPGKIKLVVAKCWEPNPKSYFTIPRGDPVQPIDLEAWVHHTEAARGLNVHSEYPMRPPSVSTLTSTSSSITSSYAESDQRKLIPGGTELNINMDMLTIVKAMAKPDSGLSVENRKWLKIEIPNAFLGSDVVDWLYSKVQGFQDKKEALNYAKQLLESGYIKHTVKRSFSENSYYIFDKIFTSGLNGRIYNDDEYDTETNSLLGGFQALQLNPSNSPSHWQGANNGSAIHNYATCNKDAYLPQYMPCYGETIDYGVFGGRGPGSRCGSGGGDSSHHQLGERHATISDRQSVSPGVSNEQSSQRSGSNSSYHQPSNSFQQSSSDSSNNQQQTTPSSLHLFQPPFAPHPDIAKDQQPPHSSSNSSENSGQSSMNTLSTRDTAIAVGGIGPGGHPKSSGNRSIGSSSE